MGFPVGSAAKDSTCSGGVTGDASSIPRSGRSSGGGHAACSSASLPAESHEQGSLSGYNLWGCKRSDIRFMSKSNQDIMYKSVLDNDWITIGISCVHLPSNYIHLILMSVSKSSIDSVTVYPRLPRTIPFYAHSPQIVISNFFHKCSDLDVKFY